jgi:DNA-binding transcriptional ArsR family regulator
MRSVLDAVAVPIRREILRLVRHEERAAGEIAGAFDVTFGAVSQHLRVLREAGLVDVRQEGRRRIYRARPDRAPPLWELLEQEWAGRLDLLRELAERREEKETR